MLKEFQLNTWNALKAVQDLREIPSIRDTNTIRKYDAKRILVLGNCFILYPSPRYMYLAYSYLSTL
jgi:hypothetical protein